MNSQFRTWGPIVCMLLNLGSPAGAAPAAEVGAPAVEAELQQETYLYEIMRHLYRWYLDEADIEPIIQKKQVVFQIRPLRPELDEGDNSRFAAIRMPELNIEATVKRADYVIDELGIAVKSDTYKIISVKREIPSEVKQQDSTEVVIEYSVLRDYLFKTRNQSRFPEGDLLAHMRHAVRKKLEGMGRAEEIRNGAGPPVVHFAPLSPVANEAWVFVEDKRLLIRCASDLDLENPAVWEHDDLAVNIYETDRQTVVSLDEVAGSNAYMTRDQVGRALFNCIILGRRVQLEPLKASADE